VRSVDLHLPVEPIVKKEVVGHSHAVGLHGVALAVVVVPNVTIIVVANLRLAVGLHFVSSKFCKRIPIENKPNH
jgi:hypothetical protein